MNAELLEKIVDAVLYEGYILYPYRPSSVKNQQRWTFGGLYPQASHLVRDQSESAVMQTQCIVEGSDETTLNISVRFLHLVTRTVGSCEIPDEQSGVGVTARHPATNHAADETNGQRWASIPALQDREIPDQQSRVGVPTHHLLDEAKSEGWANIPTLQASDDSVPPFHPVDSLRVGGKVYQSWEEATEREITVPPLNLGGLCRRSIKHSFAFPSGRSTELLRRDDDGTAGVLIRQHDALAGDVELSAERKSDDAFQITIRVVNRSAMPDPEKATRQQAQIYSLASTHTIISVDKGALVSAIDPPERFAALQKQCVGKGSWPVLIGQEPQRHTMLASPIILYDYPQIAPESQGNLFDSTEIDEILSLRIMTLTDAEKEAIGGADERARSLLQRTDALGREQMASMHGAVRGLKTITSGEPAHD